MDNMEQMKVVRTIEEADAMVARLYHDGFEAYVLPMEEGKLVVRWNEYQ